MLELGKRCCESLLRIMELCVESINFEPLLFAGASLFLVKAIANKNATMIGGIFAVPKHPRICLSLQLQKYISPKVPGRIETLLHITMVACQPSTDAG
jgi:hypothetical protein